MNNKNITVDKMVEICEGTVVSRGTRSTIGEFEVDTRKLNKGDMFLSLKNDKETEIKHIVEAFEKDAMGCITEKDIPEDIIKKHTDKLIVKVENGIIALQKLAQYKRSLYDIPVIAITGSVGKTSTKDIIANVLKQDFTVVKTKGNYNNHLGVPITILSWKEDTTAAVVEMGMNHLGEIDVITKIAKPTISVITNVGTAHIGLLGSRENILKAKLEILNGLIPNGKIIINNDNDMLNKCDTGEYTKITYGIDNKSDYMAYNIQDNSNNATYKINIKDKEEEIFVPVAGRHFIYNSLCAIAVGIELGINIEKIKSGIKLFELTEKRNEIIEKNSLKIINDYYNASFDSMKAGIEVLANIKAKRKIAILGDMLELGEYTEKLHRKVGEEVYKNKIDVLYTIGKLAQYIAKEAKELGIKEVYMFNTNEECMQKIKENVKKEDAILLKASNRMNFEEISKFLQGGILWGE